MDWRKRTTRQNKTRSGWMEYFDTKRNIQQLYTWTRSKKRIGFFSTPFQISLTVLQTVSAISMRGVVDLSEWKKIIVQSALTQTECASSMSGYLVLDHRSVPNWIFLTSQHPKFTSTYRLYIHSQRLLRLCCDTVATWGSRTRDRHLSKHSMDGRGVLIEHSDQRLRESCQCSRCL